MVVNIRKEGSCSLSYLSLNPALALKRLINQVDKIVLASGTLEPTEEYDVLQKYMGDNSSFMCKFSCDHVIPQENFRAVVLSKFMDQSFDFRYGIRDSPKQLNTLAQLVI